MKTVKAKLFKDNGVTYVFNMKTGLLRKYVNGKQVKQRQFNPGAIKNLYSSVTFNMINIEDIL